ncbi:hypothetical protein HK405_003005 [Cladochytrium tenue]|nr:hypothetical protein HK405_003005 [Cladochytrium tenue]
MILPTTQIEYAVYSAGRYIAKELELVFTHYASFCSDRGLSGAADRTLARDALVVPALQRTQTNIMVVNSDTNWERNLLLEFVICSAIFVALI